MYQHPVMLVQYFTNRMRHQQIDTNSFLVYTSSRLRIEIAALKTRSPDYFASVQSHHGG
jgi:hypothetical protein